MVHRKLIGPALAVTAALLAFGGVAAAQSPVGTAPWAISPPLVAQGFVVPAVAAAPAEPCDPEEAASPDTDDIQEGDQTGPEEATDAEEADGPDTDDIQEGDQTGPEEACTADAAASANTMMSFTSAAQVPHVQAAAEVHATSAELGESEASGESSAESDGPGGHEDAGPNADHQFEGEE